MGTYPLPVYHFVVEWGGATTGFTEVSGLSVENEVIEYREGSTPEYSVIKMPGRRKFSNITLKRGITKRNKDFFNWMNTIQHNLVERRNVAISLLNENHEPICIWRIRNAWPCKVVWPDLKADGHEVAIETIELAHEGIEMEVV